MCLIHQCGRAVESLMHGEHASRVNCRKVRVVNSDSIRVGMLLNRFNDCRRDAALAIVAAELADAGGND
jgi:hypothetical protein